MTVGEWVPGAWSVVREVEGDSSERGGDRELPL